MKDALAKISFNGVSGKITFDAQHNPIKSATILAVTDGGDQVQLRRQPVTALVRRRPSRDRRPQ